MDMSEGQRITCEACGKSYAFKPEYAGRTLKCKCGATISVPAPEEAVPDDEACPHCAAGLAPGAVLCTSCGYNLKTGQVIGTDVESASAPAARKAKSPAPAAAAAPAGDSGRPGRTLAYAGSRRPAAKDPHREAEIRKIIMLSVGFLVVALVIAGAVVALKFVGKGEPGKGQDDEAKRFIYEDSMVPMGKWFDTGPDQKMFGGYNKRQARSRYDEWMKMGLKEIWISNAMMSFVVIFELPDDPDTRKKIYEWQADWHAKQFKQAATDAGGKYLIIHIPMVNM